MFPPIHIFDVPQLVGSRPHGKTPDAAFVSVSGRRRAGGNLCAGTRRAGANTVGAFREILAVQRGCGPHRENSAVGFAGNRARAFARRSLRPLSGEVPRRVGQGRNGSLRNRTSCSPFPLHSMKKRASSPCRPQRMPGYRISRCSKSLRLRFIRGLLTIWRNRARSCSMVRLCSSAMWAAAPATSA